MRLTAFCLKPGMSCACLGNQLPARCHESKSGGRPGIPYKKAVILRQQNESRENFLKIK